MRRQDDGFVAVAVAGFILVLISVAILVTSLAAVAVARHRAAAAADLAALAAAAHALEGQDVACRVASLVAQGQGAVVQSCSLDGGDALVVVSVRPAGGLGDLGVATARARAGTSSGAS